MQVIEVNDGRHIPELIAAERDIPPPAPKEPGSPQSKQLAALVVDNYDAMRANRTGDILGALSNLGAEAYTLGYQAGIDCAMRIMERRNGGGL